jgi:alkane 1-monooxygenase
MNFTLRKIGFFTAFILPALLIAGFYTGGWWNYATLVFAFLVMPFVDQWAGVDTGNVPENKVAQVGEEFYYRFVTFIWTYFQIGLLIWGAYAVSSGKLDSWWAWTGFTFSFGVITGGIGITVAHELGHKNNSLERFYGKTLLMTVCYMHFYIEHNRGHHVHVATREDPATALKGESFYRFWVKSVFEGYAHAWRIESESLARKNKPVLSLNNQMIPFVILPIIFCAALFAGFSYWHQRPVWEIPVFFFTQSFIALTLLELVNYVEHYGILRKELSPGKYERVNALHSWNASHLISNFFLFQLQRHSDHHTAAYKRYQILDHHDESPQLPFGYPTMIMIALIPPLWFSLMDKRLDRWDSFSRVSDLGS